MTSSSPQAPIAWQRGLSSRQVLRVTRTVNRRHNNDTRHMTRAELTNELRECAAELYGGARWAEPATPPVVEPIALDGVALRSYEPYYLLFTLYAMIEREGKITPANWNDAIERAQAFKSERAGHLDLEQS